MIYELSNLGAPVGSDLGQVMPAFSEEERSAIYRHTDVVWSIGFSF